MMMRYLESMESLHRFNLMKYNRWYWRLARIREFQDSCQYMQSLIASLPSYKTRVVFYLMRVHSFQSCGNTSFSLSKTFRNSYLDRQISIWSYHCGGAETESALASFPGEQVNLTPSQVLRQNYYCWGAWKLHIFCGAASQAPKNRLWTCNFKIDWPTLHSSHIKYLRAVVQPCQSCWWNKLQRNASFWHQVTDFPSC